MIAFTAIGRFDDLDQATASMVHIKDKFEPNMEVHKIYDRIYNEIFVKIFDKLKPLYNISRGDGGEQCHIRIKNLNRNGSTTTIQTKSYRSIFKWGEKRQIKAPRESLYKMIKDVFELTDDDFKGYTEDLGVRRGGF